MTKKGLTISIIMLAESANYGEGIGNISALKKMSRGDHNQYSYISRQALRYNLVNQLEWDKTPVEDQGSVQFASSASIEDYPEIDLFGYMKTKKGKNNDSGTMKTRSAVARLSNAIALEPYQGDLEFLNNMGLARRENLQNGIVQMEIHRSYYTYTLTIDLDRVGVDGKIEISANEKAARVKKLLEAIQFLWRDIKGRRENLSPLFVIGGVYDRKNPYFMHRLLVRDGKIVVETLQATIESCEDTKNNTVCGFVPGIFANDAELKEKLGKMSVSDVFAELEKSVGECYGA